VEDKIIIKNMKFYGYHGVLEEEKKLGQIFHVDLEIYKNMKLAGTTDDLNYTLDYSKVYENVKKIVEEQKFNLIEALAEKIAIEILKNKHVQKIKVQVKKPAAPINGCFDYVAVEIVRESDEKI